MATRTAGSGAGGGPEITAPVVGLNRPSWQGHRMYCLLEFHSTTQPRCVQMAENALTPPCAVLTTITGLSFTGKTLACPTARSLTPPTRTRDAPAVARRAG